MSGSEDKSRKRLMPVFMFIGMGVGFMMIDYLGGTAFVAFMFIGMGLGFLFDTFFEVEARRVKAQVPLKVGGMITMALGLIFVVGGALAVLAPDLLMKVMTFFIGLGFIAVGIYLLIHGFSLVKTG